MRLRAADTIFRVSNLPLDPDDWFREATARLNQLESAAERAPACGWTDSEDAGYLGLTPSIWPRNWLREADEVLRSLVESDGVDISPIRPGRGRDPRSTSPLGVLAGVDLGDEIDWQGDGPSARVLAWMTDLLGPDQPQLWTGNALFQPQASTSYVVPLLLKTYQAVVAEDPTGTPHRTGVVVDRKGHVRAFVRGPREWDEAWRQRAEDVARAVEALSSPHHPAYLIPYRDELPPGVNTRVSYRERPDLGRLTPDDPLWMSDGPGTAQWFGDLAEWWPPSRHS